MRILELDQTASGQWRYRILDVFDGETRIRVDWEWGTRSEQETENQARNRFGGYDKKVVLDWI